MSDEIKQELKHEAEEIADNTRSVPVTLVTSLAIALTLLGAIALFVYRDTQEGSLADSQGIVNEESRELLDAAPVE